MRAICIVSMVFGAVLGSWTETRAADVGGAVEEAQGNQIKIKADF